MDDDNPDAAVVVVVAAAAAAVVVTVPARDEAHVDLFSGNLVADFKCSTSFVISPSAISRSLPILPQIRANPAVLKVVGCWIRKACILVDLTPSDSGGKSCAITTIFSCPESY